MRATKSRPFVRESPLYRLITEVRFDTTWGMHPAAIQSICHLLPRLIHGQTNGTRVTRYVGVEGRQPRFIMFILLVLKVR